MVSPLAPSRFLSSFVAIDPRTLAGPCRRAMGFHHILVTSRRENLASIVPEWEPAALLSESGCRFRREARSEGPEQAQDPVQGTRGLLPPLPRPHHHGWARGLDDAPADGLRLRRGPPGSQRRQAGSFGARQRSAGREEPCDLLLRACQRLMEGIFTD